METILLVGGVMGLILWLASGSKAASTESAPADASKKMPAAPVPTVKKAVCAACMCPDATITLVKAQEVLIKLNYLPAKTASGKPGADGNCGSMTSAAIRNYQVARKLVVSGFIDKETSVALANEKDPSTMTSTIVTVPATTPASTTPPTDVEAFEAKSAAEDYAQGCNAGSKDARLSAEKFMASYSRYVPGTNITTTNDNFENISKAWEDGYRTCFTAALTKSAILLDEDGYMYRGEWLDDSNTEIVGDVLDESEADSGAEVSGRGVDYGSRYAYVKGRADARRATL